MNEFKEDKFDYLQYLYTFLKDKKIFFYALGVSLFLGLIYAFTKENEFIGNFESVNDYVNGCQIMTNGRGKINRLLSFPIRNSKYLPIPKKNPLHTMQKI